MLLMRTNRVLVRFKRILVGFNRDFGLTELQKNREQPCQTENNQK